MDTTVHAIAHHAPDPLRAVPTAQTVSVSAVYHLSEAGRKASLIAGGDGKGVQRLTVQVPTTRLHLVAVGLSGNARLKLQPHFERVDGQVLRHDDPPVFDAPPTLEELFHLAARNHELAREFRSSRAESRDAQRERRTEVARAFLADSTQRAMVRPAPTPRRCYLATSWGRVMFDGVLDKGLAGDVPREAYRRFRADERLRKEAHLQRRAADQVLHQEKTRVVAEWVATHGSDDQRGRHAAGLLPITEVIDALTDAAFASVRDLPPYPLDGVERLQAHVRALTGNDAIIVAPSDVIIVGADATDATAAEWAVMQQLKTRLPDADVKLRAHRLSWRRDPSLPALSLYGVLATRRVGPLTVRREFAVPAR
jgi:D-aminopeptidase